MLQVTYEATDDLEPGRLARIDEDRGVIHVKVDKFAPLKAVIDQLNTEVGQVLAGADWYQLWRDEIVSRHTPDRPLRVEHVLLPGAPDGAGIAEVRGAVHIYIDPQQDTEQFVAAVNPAMANFLNAGCWFQLYAGEIIDHSPEPVSQV